jgi:uncharacterized membrane protein
MNWRRRYRTQLYIRNSMWVFPAIGIVAGWVAVAFMARFERAMGWEIDISRETALTVMGTVAASMFSLLVVVSSALLLAVQLASAQLTPRIITLIYRNNARKLSVAVFAFTFTFSVSFLVRIETAVPLVTGYLAAYGFLLNLALFLYFIDGMGKALRPSSALREVALAGREVIPSVYPQRLDESKAVTALSSGVLDGNPNLTVLNDVDGAVLACDLKGLVAIAERSNCLIELVPEVGDFVAAGDPLFRVFAGGDNVSKRALRNSVALGQERTLEQDPMFAFRIIVDIASKALSPAVNDPTTAVLAIDQIHHLLRDVGGRSLANGIEADGAGQVRLVYRTPNWEDFVSIAVTEIRQYGSGSIQVMRRLQAMLESLIATLPESRRAVLLLELNLLQSTVERTFIEPEDRVRASVSDLQGVGGRPEVRRRRNDLRPM